MSDVYQTEILEVVKVDPNQTETKVTVNEALDQITKCIGKPFTVDFDTADPYTLPYDPAEGGDKSGLHNLVYFCIGSPGAGTSINEAELIHPPVPHHFYLLNGTDSEIFVHTGDDVSGSDGVTVPAGTGANLYCDGVDIVFLLDTVQLQGTPNDFNFATPPGTLLTASQLIGTWSVTRNTLVEADWGNAFGQIRTNPTATLDIDVKQNGVTVGTISISTGGVFTFTTTSNEQKIFSVGDIIDFFGPGSPDATGAGINVGIVARTVS